MFWNSNFPIFKSEPSFSFCYSPFNPSRSFKTYLKGPGLSPSPSLPHFFSFLLRLSSLSSHLSPSSSPSVSRNWRAAPPLHAADGTCKTTIVVPSTPSPAWYLQNARSVPDCQTRARPRQCRATDSNRLLCFPAILTTLSGKLTLFSPIPISITSSILPYFEISNLIPNLFLWSSAAAVVCTLAVSSISSRWRHVSKTSRAATTSS